MKKSLWKRAAAGILSILFLAPAFPAEAMSDGSATGGIDFDGINHTESRLLYGDRFYFDWSTGTGLTGHDDALPGRDCSGSAENGSNPNMVFKMTVTFDAVDGTSDPAACWNHILVRLRSSMAGGEEQPTDFYSVTRAAYGDAATVNVQIPLSAFGSGSVNWADIKDIIVQIPVEEDYKLGDTGDSPAVKATISGASIVNYANLEARTQLEKLLAQTADYTYDYNEAATAYELVRQEAEALLDTYADAAAYDDMLQRFTAAFDALTGKLNTAEQFAVLAGQNAPYPIDGGQWAMSLTTPAVSGVGAAGDREEWYLWWEGILTAPEGYVPPDTIGFKLTVDWYSGETLLRSIPANRTEARVYADGHYGFRWIGVEAPDGFDRAVLRLSCEAWQTGDFAFTLTGAGINNGYNALQTSFLIDYLQVETPALCAPSDRAAEAYYTLREKAGEMARDRIWYTNGQLQAVYRQLLAARHNWRDISGGDVDNDMQITASDALMVLQAATNKIVLEDMTMADVDKQSGVTAGDALQVLQYATKKITAFPTAEQRPADAAGIIHAQEAQGRYHTAPTALAPDASSMEFTENGGYLAYRGIDFGSGASTTFMAVLAVPEKAVGKALEIHLDTPNGDILGVLTMKDSGGDTIFAEQYASLSKTVSGVHDVYLVAPEAAGVHLDWFTFSAYDGEETAEEKAQRMAWWNDARYGMFVHWGAYANFPFDETGPVDHYTEWVQDTLKISKEDYERMAVSTFNPQHFDAEEVVRLAKDAGQKYLVFTSKHHEGFSMFDTQVTGFKDFSLLGYGLYNGADPLMELAEASRAAGIPLGCYYSTMDWRHDATVNWGSMLDKPRYVADMKAQLRELLENYDLDILWFDGEWVDWWTTEDGRDLYRYLRTIKPSLIINNRVGKRAETDGDFGTPEQEIPANGLNYDWESCITMNNNWGYAPYDDNWKSPEWVVRSVVDTASKGGNILLNIGPDEQGLIPEACAANMRKAGEWFAAYGDSIYSTTASPFAEALPFGAATKKDGVLYLHVTKWPQNGQITLPSLQNTLTGVRVMGTDTSLAYTENGGTMTITLPATIPNALDTVIEVLVEGVPQSGKSYTYSENYALNKPATVSNHYQNDAQYSGSAAVDGNSATRWATDDDITESWLEVDLGKETTFNAIRCSEFTSTGGQRVTAYNLEYWHGSEWKVAFTGTGIGDQHTDLFDAVTARKVRLHILSIDENAQGGPSLWEFGVYHAVAAE